MIQFIRDMMKSNDNRKDDPPPKMTGEFPVDAVALFKHWKLNDEQIRDWMILPSLYLTGLDSLSKNVLASREVKTKKHITAHLVAVGIATLNYLFATIKMLPDEEAMFLLNQIHEENDKFVQERTKH